MCHHIVHCFSSLPTLHTYSFTHCIDWHHGCFSLEILHPAEDMPLDMEVSTCRFSRQLLLAGVSHVRKRGHLLLPLHLFPSCSIPSVVRGCSYNLIRLLKCARMGFDHSAHFLIADMGTRYHVLCSVSLVWHSVHVRLLCLAPSFYLAL